MTLGERKISGIKVKKNTCMEFKREMSDLPKVRRLKEALLLTTCFVVVVLDFFF